MKFTAALCAAVALLASSTSGHTWLDCVDVDIKNEAEARDPSIRATPQYDCHGYPRNKLYDGDWIAESTKYCYTLNSNMYGLDTKYACRQDIQANLGEEAPGKPKLTAKPGQELQMRFWGNGHSDYHVGSPRNADPGVVRVYWAGEPEKQIELVEDLTEAYWVPGAQSNFSENSITWRDVTPMLEPGNFMKWKIPEKIQNGVHAFVFAWANNPGAGDPQPLEADVYNKHWQNSFTTCFDIKIEGSDYNEAKSDAIRINQSGYDSRKEKMADQAETCSKKCFHAGNMDLPCEGDSCPPCRYARGEGVFHCYQYNNGACPWADVDADCGKNYKKRNVLARSHARKHRRARRI